jgi:hypothetical protein
MSLPIYQRLVSHWRAEGLKLSTGCNEQDLLRFERAHDVTLPDDLRSYFLHVNGMLPDAMEDCDQNGFCFWPLARMKSIAKERALHSSPMLPGPEDQHYFVFADYLQWSWAYAIRLTKNSLDPNQVVIMGKPRIVAGSFGEFVELYLRDAEELYLV